MTIHCSNFAEFLSILVHMNVLFSYTVTFLMNDIGVAIMINVIKSVPTEYILNHISNAKSS